MPWNTANCDAASTGCGCVWVSSRADDCVQFARLDPHDGDSHRAATGRFFTGCRGTGRSAVTDVRA
jgi:hypothetical protein